jgi:hypothetical protein
MVFALSAEQNITRFAPPRQPTSGKYTCDKFTAYDIWCTGLSHKTFAVIGKDDLLPYKHLLHRTRHTIQYDVTKSFKLKYPMEVAGKLGELLRHFDPLLECGPGHQSAYVPREGRMDTPRSEA